MSSQDDYVPHHTGVVTTEPSGGHGLEQRIAANQRGTDWRQGVAPATERFAKRFDNLADVRIG